MSTERLLTRPLFGGVFGNTGQYCLATMPCVRRGLHGVEYLVVDPTAGAVISTGENAADALCRARTMLEAANDAHGPRRERMSTQLKLWPEELPPTQVAAPHVSRRRREIFERTHGKCFYCSTSLELAGPWHVEHQLPRALGGQDGMLNLVASCVRCNLQKRDRTAIEFVVGAGCVATTT
jgi:5-methylcytosine-specific restriction endonuclease McrA